MKKSYRKEVIIARCIFAAVLLVLIGLIIFAATFISNGIGKKDSQDSQSRVESQISQETEEDKSGEDDSTTEMDSVEIQPSETEASEIETSESESEQSEEAENQDSPSQDVWTTIVNVNFRTEPNTTSQVIFGIDQGTEITLVAIENDWAKVSYKGYTGYIKAELLQKKSVSVEDSEENDGNTAENTSAGNVVVIDPGHQKKGDNTKEANGPGSSTMKPRVSAGTTGKTTGVPEYELNLEIGLLLKTELESRGYTVYMTRTTHDVNISNKERAEYATSVQADIAVRLHGNGVDDTSVSGALTLSPSSSNPYIPELADSSMTLSKCILNAYCDATGMKNQGCQTSDTMTGINWSTVPVTILEMGFMTNSSDDTNMQDDAFQTKMIQGIADGIDDYFGR